MSEQMMDIWNPFRDEMKSLLDDNLRIDAFVGIGKECIYIVVPSMNYRYEYPFERFYEDVYLCKLSVKNVYFDFEKSFKNFVISNTLKTVFKEKSL